MDYRIEPTRLGRRSGRAVLISAATVVIGLGVIVAGLAFLRPATPAPSLAEATIAPTARPTPSPTPRPPITCHDLEPARCTEVAEAALAAIDDPSLPIVRGVEVWATLVCGDTLDCPPSRLGKRSVAGSAIVGLADDVSLWVNVTDAGRGMLDAWVVRTQHRSSAHVRELVVEDVRTRWAARGDERSGPPDPREGPTAGTLHDRPIGS